MLNAVCNCSVSAFSYVQDDGTYSDGLYLRHLDRLFHFDSSYSDGDFGFPPPDIVELQEFFNDQTVFVDTAVVLPDDIGGELLYLLPEIEKRHEIKNLAAILVAEGNVGLEEAETAINALAVKCDTVVLPASFYKIDIPDKVYISLWWFDRRRCYWEK